MVFFLYFYITLEIYTHKDYKQYLLIYIYIYKFLYLYFYIFIFTNLFYQFDLCLNSIQIFTFI